MSGISGYWIQSTAAIADINRRGLSPLIGKHKIASILKGAACLGVFWSSARLLPAQAPEFTVEGRPVQIHAFASQGFAGSDQNNYLTMNTSAGSFAFTDFGANISAQVTSKFHVGAQIYDRDIGQLGRWHPELDWADGDYKFADWFGIRAGKIKTVMGLYNDTQDYEFLHTWAILPQSMYPLDLRSVIAHVGGDFYGNIGLKRLGSLSYTAYAGLIPDDPYGGYVYGSKAYGFNVATLGARGEGGDLRWNMPVQGLLGGVSYMDGNSHAKGIDALGLPYSSQTKKYEISQFYLQYVHGGLRLDAEYRRTYLDDLSSDILTPPETVLDSRSIYGSASYRISKRLELGTYYSRFYLNWAAKLSDPANHIFDKVATARLDLTGHWDLKIEGHFMNGYGASDAFRGFYLQNNPQGFQPTTNMLVIRTGVEF